MKRKVMLALVSHSQPFEIETVFLTALEFKELTGRLPVDDDLVRANCQHVGDPGHFLCGICNVHAQPRFMCGCAVRNAER